MINDKPTFVQAIIAQLEILPLLAHGSNAAVFKCIELFEADPMGASKRDILDYTGLSRPTVENALRVLEKAEIIHYTPETRRFRCSQQYVSFGGSPQDVRELVPIIQGESREPAKKFLSSPMDGTLQDSLPKESIKNHPSMQAHEKIFSEIVDQPSVLKVARCVESVEQARAWVTFMRTNPLRKTSPIGWSIWYLQKHPNTFPPGHKPEPRRVPRLSGAFAERIGIATDDDSQEA